MRRQSCREAKRSAAAGAVVSALYRPSTVDNRQFVTSGVNRGSCSNVAAVCCAHQRVCSSIQAVCFDFLRSFGLNAARSGHESSAWSINNCFVRVWLADYKKNTHTTVFSVNKIMFDVIKVSIKTGTNPIYFGFFVFALLFLFIFVM